MTEPQAPAGWPDYPQTDADRKGLAEAVYSAQLIPGKSRAETREARYRSQFEAENDLFKGFHTALRDVAKATAGRVDTLAQLIQASAGAIVTLYTGALALVFAADGEPLPLRALVPALFLGLAIALATAYAAFLTPVPQTKYTPSSFPRQNALVQTNTFLQWVGRRNNNRARAIRAAVVALGLGVLFLPSPFVSLGGTEAASPPVNTIEFPAVPTDSSPEAIAEMTVARYQAELTEVAGLRVAEREATPQPKSFEVGPLSMQQTDAWILLFAAIAAIIGFGIAFLYRAPSDDPPLQAEQMKGQQTTTTTS